MKKQYLSLAFVIGFLSIQLNASATESLVGKYWRDGSADQRLIIDENFRVSTNVFVWNSGTSKPCSISITSKLAYDEVDDNYQAPAKFYCEYEGHHGIVTCGHPLRLYTQTPIDGRLEVKFVGATYYGFDGSHCVNSGKSELLLNFTKTN